MKPIALLLCLTALFSACNDDIIINEENLCPDAKFNDDPLCTSKMCEPDLDFVWCADTPASLSPVRDYITSSEEYIILISLEQERLWFYNKDSGTLAGEMEIPEDRDLIYQVEVVGNTLIIAYRNIAIDAYDLDLLALRWSVQSTCEQELLNAKMTIEEDRLLLSTRNKCDDKAMHSKCIAIDMLTGETEDLILFSEEEMQENYYPKGIKKWTNAEGENIYIILVHNNKHVYTNEIWAYNMDQQKYNWKIEGLEISTIHDFAPIIYEDQMIFVGKHINVIDLKAGIVRKNDEALGAPLAMFQLGSDLYLKTELGGFRRVDISTGETYWSLDNIHTPREVNVVGDDVYCTQNGWYAYADISDGSNYASNELLKWKTGEEYLIDENDGELVYYVYFNNQIARIE